MIKKIIVLVVFCFTLLSCGVVTGIVMNSNSAKKIGKAIVNTDLSNLNLDKLNISNEFKIYLMSEKGKEYYDKVRINNGILSTLKLRKAKGSTTDTMNYRFIGRFKHSEAIQEVRVQTFEQNEIVGIFVGPWKDEMESLK